MSDRIQVEAIPNVPFIDRGDDIAVTLTKAAEQSNFQFEEHDILCVASKAVSLAEGRTVTLSDIEPSELALEIHEKIPRKDPRAIQAIIDETGDPSGSRLEVTDNYIAGWLPNGYRLTGAGVDKMDKEHVILLPENPDASARVIGENILAITGVEIAVVITDSDGRVEKAGSTQVAIGLYGLPGIRTSKFEDDDGNTKVAEETLSDLVAASAAILMGQRGTNKPAVVVRGLDYQFNPDSEIKQVLSRPE